jgi:hypothetical protein
MLSIDGKAAFFSTTILLALDEEVFFKVPELKGGGASFKAFENPPVGGAGVTIDMRGTTPKISFNILRLAPTERQIDNLPGVETTLSARIVAQPVGDFQLVRIAIFDMATLYSD